MNYKFVLHTVEPLIFDLDIIDSSRQLISSIFSTKIISQPCNYLQNSLSNSRCGSAQAMDRQRLERTLFTFIFAQTFPLDACHSHRAQIANVADDTIELEAIVIKLQLTQHALNYFHICFLLASTTSITLQKGYFSFSDNPTFFLF